MGRSTTSPDGNNICFLPSWKLRKGVLLEGSDAGTAGFETDEVAMYVGSRKFNTCNFMWRRCWCHQVHKHILQCGRGTPRTTSKDGIHLFRGEFLGLGCLLGPEKVFPIICLPKFLAKFGWTFWCEFLLKPFISCGERPELFRKFLGSLRMILCYWKTFSVAKSWQNLERNWFSSPISLLWAPWLSWQMSTLLGGLFLDVSLSNWMGGFNVASCLPEVVALWATFLA